MGTFARLSNSWRYKRPESKARKLAYNKAYEARIDIKALRAKRARERRKRNSLKAIAEIDEVI